LYIGRNLAPTVTGGLAHTHRNGYPFAENSALRTVTVGKDVTAINANSFLNCSGITQITSNPATPPTIQSNTFTGITKSIPVRVPSGVISTYRGAPFWNEFTNFQGM